MSSFSTTIKAAVSEWELEHGKLINRAAEAANRRDEAIATANEVRDKAARDLEAFRKDHEAMERLRAGEVHQVYRSRWSPDFSATGNGPMASATDPADAVLMVGKSDAKPIYEDKAYYWCKLGEREWEPARYDKEHNKFIGESWGAPPSSFRLQIGKKIVREE